MELRVVVGEPRCVISGVLFVVALISDGINYYSAKFGGCCKEMIL